MKLRHVVTVGFALFSMLFGAGNVIFPPYLGLSCGSAWAEGFFYYYLADIVLALLCLFAIQRGGGHRSITGHLGRIPGQLLTCVIILCIGPMLGIPRTAASVLEMSVLPLIPGADPVVFSLIFFGLVALLSLKENAVVDIIGKFLTPALLASLLVLILAGLLHPLGPADGPVLAGNVPVTGIHAGYQTMDVLAVVIFGILISRAVREKGCPTRSCQNRMVFLAGVIAGLSLMGIYMGLTYLGATASGRFDLTVDRTALITAIVHLLLGQTGTVIFSLVVALACVTTAVALVSACSDYFSSLTGGKLGYTPIVLLLCGFSAVVSNFGLNQIISIASPILDVVYPPTLVLILLSWLDRWIPSPWVYRLGALGSCLVSLMAVLTRWGAPFTFLRSLPLYEYGFGWLLPALVFAALGFFLPRKKNG